MSFFLCGLVGHDLMMKSVILVVSLLGLVFSVNGQFLQEGQCDPNISLQANFNGNQFSGVWYEIARAENPSQQGECSTVSFTGTNNQFTVSYNAVSNSLNDVTTGSATLEQGTARFNVNVGTSNTAFWVLGTNYVDYAIGYSCVNLANNMRSINIWQLGRSTTINPIFNNIMNNIVTPLGVTLANLRTVDHSEDACFALPVIPAGQPVIIPGQCNANVSSLPNFDAGRFLGLWHEIYSYHSDSVLGNCGRAEYSSGAGGVVNVQNTEVINQTLSVIPGTAQVVPGYNARLLVTLEVQPNVFLDQDLWIIDTDYENYAISYSCIDVSSTEKRVFSWIISRNPQLSPASVAAINTAVDSLLDLNFIYYQETSRSEDDCFYFPEPNTNQIVEFRGPCDLTIPAQQNFNAEAYQGLWHDIASYPSGFQEGTCNNALYTLLPGPVVDVFNTQVINQTLDTLRGTAVPVSTDGSAKLEVTFPVVGTDFTITTSYWVLSTDYTNYALVYTCQYNSATDRRQVWSWKLSRSKELSPASNTAINNVIATIPVLDERYYITRDQSREGCFHFPEPQEGVRVVFPGQCEHETFAAVPNFNLALFQGTWYEIETYPKDEAGDCVEHAYTAAGNTLNLISSFNVDQFLQTSSSVLTFASTDNSASFLIDINVGNNQVIRIPFWILAIDANYNDHALAYSCVNLNSDYRAVYSWKLSRTRQLSATAQTAINNYVTNSNIAVLDNRYFEQVDHSEYACASLPEIPAGQPIIIEGRCDFNVPVVQNFSPGDYVGLWHLIESYPSEFQNGDCNDATYTAQPDGSVLVFNTQVINQTLDTITGRAVLATTDGRGILDVTFPDSPNIQYFIIDTDYVSYSLVYSCVDLPDNTQRVFSWKLSRTKSLTAAASTAINNSMRNIRVLNNRYFYDINKSDEACFYFPEPNGLSVVFRGQCDETIPVVTNFNAVAYQGLWYDIESYPQFFQNGTCSTADYTLRDGGVDVFNTQVINRRLDTIVGRAELIPSDDGSAKLNVSFPIAGTDLDIFSPYWVLATDYNNYAFVYSCQNINEDSRLVSSWKLSRQRTLSAASQTAINNVIATVDVLRQEYYEVQGHTDEQCFYLPEPNGEPIVFRGQCDNSVAAVPNFNLAAFAGVWNEVETYPKEQVGGQCIHHEFTSTNSPTSLQLTSNQVFNSETLVSNEGQLQLVSTDNSGRFSLSINVNNETFVIPYWVLATDYSNYALVYSCMNLDAERRAVYSWKLSRSAQLTNAANTAINAVIASVDVLEQQYYEPVRQDDVACFYLPELGPNEPVVFRGQCNMSIPVVQNFNPGNYVGLWYLVESYPSEFQNGECNDATYTAQPDGSVLVFNTQVINQTLDTITGRAVLATTDGRGILDVTFPDPPTNIQYWIIDTDYESYSLVYSCASFPDNSQRVWSWKLSRTKSLTAAATTAISNSMRDIRVLDDRYFYEINNSDEACFYFPEPNGLSVIFRGQCDETIPVVTNFNAVAYQGLWYDIESYPQFFQNGTCSTADYTLRDGGVDVFNTQVINRRLDTIVGRAELIPSDDGSAKLNVSFPIAGTDLDIFSPYWVLATDYINYAFVYSCQNINEDSRLVSSWKLSRQRALSPASQTAINNVIATVDVLRQEYFEVQGHTDEQCFYLPEPNGEPVVFRGQCDNSVAAVPNFNLAAFAGVWNEVETYPKEQVGGQCIHHEFTSTNSPTSLQLTSNQVFNSETLVSNEGQIQLISTDNSGRFTLSINVNNETIVIPYWVLATDYSNYALVYSCMNLDSERRAVYSWKLSRSSSLSNAANVAMNAVIEAVEVLDQQYFEPVRQDAEACFYLPDIGLNEPAVFPGQCENVPVIQNFSPNQFAGRWFDIESYFDDYQGTCSDGSFTLSANGFNVILTQVVDGTLDVTESSATIAADNSGRLTVTVNNVQYEYYILDTDYNSYSLIYSCQNVGSNQRRVRSWKLSRTRQLTPNATVAIDTIVTATNVLNERYFIKRDHSESGCFYYPVPNGLPVRFRGRCDDTIPVVSNFNAGEYLGIWYDIESYPQAFQDGQCATANYSPGPDGSVNVLNTQVVNQQLDIMTGVAVSINGTAKLEVTFNLPGNVQVTTPYWILATDYVSYSFVYSCSEIDDEYKSVTAWKLSRARNLSPAANTAINSAMSTIPVLQQEYFRPIGHTEQDCFFYPDNNGGPVILDGQCPESSQVEAVINFSPNSFAGTWHEVSRFPSELQNGECASGQYSHNAQNNIFTLTQNIVLDETLVVFEGTGTVSGDGRGVISTVFNNALGSSTAFNVYVLGTDYSQYALLYSCRNINNATKQIYSWKLSRSQEGLPEAAINIINDIVTNNEDLFELYYEETKQDSDACFFELPNEIELPGLCDNTISGIPNFNSAAYLGRWFELARYPQPSQAGACNRAEYSLGNNVVDVFNTQVVNQTLQTQSGTAVVASTDGSGQLLVTFVVNGVTNQATYYILGTDYTNYALVYNCRNLANGNRLVYSWKLSRQRTLSPASEQAINNIIANTQGLNNNFYIPTSQSDEACFYFPEPNPDTHVVFRGQCGNVAGLPNFNINSYLGAWHEVKRYPTGQNDGQCTSSNFTTTGTNQFQVVDQTVFGLTGNININQVTVTNDGKITRTGEAGESEVWVVATDYNNLAVLYSCYNIDSEYQAVWSAVHSRSRVFSQESENAVNQVLDNLDYVLDGRYHVDVDQSDDACFFYPEPTGQPVTLPGQCDDNIPVVQNFAVDEYTGTWFQIERYPQAYESGNCTGARYTLNTETGEVSVLNWEVINGELDTIEGTARPLSDDGSGRLLVELPSRVEEGTNVTQRLYVLATDYTSYALTYSCYDISPYWRRVAAWKLSRTRELTPQAVTAINTYMAQRAELDQRYFISVGHDEECPDPDSGFTFKSSIIMLLVCSLLQYIYNAS